LCLSVNKIKLIFLNSWQEEKVVMCLQRLITIGDLDIVTTEKSIPFFTATLIFRLLISLPTLNVGLVNLILQKKHEVDLDMSGDTCLCFSDEGDQGGGKMGAYIFFFIWIYF
ncbi:hypothetical protein ACJX0J_021257, partial [Zea mays]